MRLVAELGEKLGHGLEAFFASTASVQIEEITNVLEATAFGIGIKSYLELDETEFVDCKLAEFADKFKETRL